MSNNVLLSTNSFIVLLSTNCLYKSEPSNLSDFKINLANNMRTLKCCDSDQVKLKTAMKKLFHYLIICENFAISCINVLIVI